jgi:hypothetical protein
VMHSSRPEISSVMDLCSGIAAVISLASYSLIILRKILMFPQAA